ncbi:SET and MYND domain-containing protein 4 [Pristis pectinata]|uniref:SET and MYND domain-containing protein 4 n=1 Tax=Pristis pectinata TaxID=685728 RepID=UPI00223E4903|nr:SET and MYND domain-containing protein 4 [Pristis pectinata]
MAGPGAGWRRVCGSRWRAIPGSERRRFGSVTGLGRAFDIGCRLLAEEDAAALDTLSAQWRAQKDPTAALDFRRQGNECFKARDYVRALALYSQGLQHSAADGPGTALLYANRSAALYHLQRYQECLEDIGRAEHHGYPAELQHKTQGRRAACLQQLGRCEGGVRPPDTGADQPDEPPPISLRYDALRGRHFTAARDLCAGQMVLRERAFSAVLIPGGQSEEHPPTQHLYCHHCLGTAPLPLPCRGCSYSCYCSERCRDQAWQLHHWLDCPLGGLLLALGTHAHLALRTVLAAGMREVERVQRSQPPCEEGARLWETGGQQPTRYQVIHSLLTHSRSQPPEHRFHCVLTAAALCRAVRDSGLEARLVGQEPGRQEPGGQPVSGGSPRTEQPVSGGSPQTEQLVSGGSLRMLGVAVLQHMLQLESNGQAITVVRDTGEGSGRVVQTRQVRIATALYSSASLFNHSCQPNTTVSFHGTRLTVRASQLIPAGQEVLHCYGPHCSRLPVQDRQRALMTQYHFRCGCRACAHEEEEGSPLLPAPFLCQHCGSNLLGSEQAQYRCSNTSCAHTVSEQHLCQQLNRLTQRVQRAGSLISAQPDTALQLLHHCQLEAGSLLSDRHRLRGEIEDCLAQVYASQGDWWSATQHLRASEQVVRLQYGSQSVELANQLFKLAQVLFNGQSVDEAMTVMDEAVLLLTTHYGPEHEMLMELREMKSCLQSVSIDGQILASLRPRRGPSGAQHWAGNTLKN